MRALLISERNYYKYKQKLAKKLEKYNQEDIILRYGFNFKHRKIACLNYTHYYQKKLVIHGLKQVTCSLNRLYNDIHVP
jgi:hypothetical protein